jgi:hypothetical protein
LQPNTSSLHLAMQARVETDNQSGLKAVVLWSHNSNRGSPDKTIWIWDWSIVSPGRARPRPRKSDHGPPPSLSPLPTVAPVPPPPTLPAPLTPPAAHGRGGADRRPSPVMQVQHPNCFGFSPIRLLLVRGPVLD